MTVLPHFVPWHMGGTVNEKTCFGSELCIQILQGWQFVFVRFIFLRNLHDDGRCNLRISNLQLENPAVSTLLHTPAKQATFLKQHYYYWPLNPSPVCPNPYILSKVRICVIQELSCSK